MQDKARHHTGIELSGASDGPVPAAGVMVFAVSGSAIDARSLGARLAQWLGPQGHVTCWVDRGLPPQATLPDPAGATASGRAAVLVLSRRSMVLAAAHRQLAGAGHPLSSLQATDARVLQEQLQRHEQAVLLLDEAWLHELDSDTARWLTARVRHRRTLLLCDHASRCRGDCALVRGLHGCLSIDAAEGVWTRAVAAVARGELWLPRAVLQQAAAGVRPPPPLPLDGLTPREAQAVSLVREGLTNKEIARRLGVGEDTIKKHLQHAFGKLGVHRRTLVALGRIEPSHP